MITPEQTEVLRRTVAGRSVWDLGAGRCDLAVQMFTELGAVHVTAVDKVYAEMDYEAPPPGITLIGKQFHEIEPVPIWVAVVSWPDYPRQTPGLVELLRWAERVVYIGSNFDGTCCGSDELWGHLTRREVLAHVPDRRNSLIVYGGVMVSSRTLLPEEYAATHREGNWIPYEMMVKA